MRPRLGVLPGVQFRSCFVPAEWYHLLCLAHPQTPVPHITRTSRPVLQKRSVGLQRGGRWPLHMHLVTEGLAVPPPDPLRLLQTGAACSVQCIHGRCASYLTAAREVTAPAREQEANGGTAAFIESARFPLLHGSRRDVDHDTHPWNLRCTGVE